MNITKFLLVMFLAVATVSCNKDDDGGGDTPFTLTNTNLSGTYKISSASATSISTTNVAGSTVTVATTTVVGDTFQVSIIFNENGSYTATGQYRIVTTITPTGGAPIVTEEILVVDSSGTYSLNSSSQTILINSNDDSFVDGLFDVALFNETTVNLTQEDISVEGGITTTTDGILNLTRI